MSHAQMQAINPIAALPPIIADHVQWWAGGAIVVLGLLVYGFRDLRVFSFSRVWAISSVCFAESIRKRVLWIAPLAILGIILISQFQRPVDEADAVRQMLKVCLFATGVVVTITAIILACTNLPKEMETRVIFTVVTKPTTRLEIVLGKVLGFARVSGAILLIMGVFTVLYLWANAWNLQRGISTRLASAQLDPTIKPTLEYYRDTGLLTARKLAVPAVMQITSRPYQPKEAARWFHATEGDVIIPFALTPQDLTPPGDPNAQPLSAGFFIQLKVGFDNRLAEKDAAARRTLPDTVANPNATVAPPVVSVGVLDEYENILVPAAVIERGQNMSLPDAAGTQPLMLFVDPSQAPNIDRWGRIFINLSGVSPNAEYKLTPESVRIIVPPVAPGVPPREIAPSAPLESWRFRGRFGRVGYQVRGGDPATEPTHVATFFFRGVEPSAEPGTGQVPLEFRSDIERSGADDRDESVTQLLLSVLNHSNGQVTDLPPVAVESNRPVYVKIPAAALVGGEFDIRARCGTSGHYLGVTRSSLTIVAANQGFGLNLLKSLVIMWLMSVLVVSVAIFCSTFVSWPIAVILTLILLLGRWTVIQLGDALQPGIGNQVATDLFGQGRPEVAVTVSKLIEALARFLNVSAMILPDISQFAAIEDLERGVAVPWSKLRDALVVLLSFGLPVTVLSYVFLRNKEVAP